MATIKAVVLKHQKKEDGTWNVKVKVTKNRESAYIASPYFVVKSELNRKYEIVDDIINTEVSNYVNSMRRELIDLGVYVESFTAKTLAEYLKTRSIRGVKNQNTDFISFMDGYVKELKKAGKGAYKNYGPALRRLKEYAGDRLLFDNITPEFLERLEKYFGKSGTGQRGILLRVVLAFMAGDVKWRRCRYPDFLRWTGKEIRGRRLLAR